MFSIVDNCMHVLIATRQNVRETGSRLFANLEQEFGIIRKRKQSLRGKNMSACDLGLLGLPELAAQKPGSFLNGRQHRPFNGQQECVLPHLHTGPDLG